ncbi:MAG TPA: thioredoxin domain-containing protein [Ferruginibacter sp.]|nr:thioredoxin domain-containing protein [Ferruginibacter sp.]
MSSAHSNHSRSNRLIHETSPYLLQHAYNPVDWYPWGEEALQKASSENKVILVSIGYSACHWCHVMEKESFENEAVAAFMNRHFVNIKIDREERPDLDHIYMDAVQAITGSGGWPLNVFLTPDKKPFYGGTYFPPVKAYNRSSWMDVLEAIQQAWRDKETEIMEQAAHLTGHLQKSNSFGLVEQNSAEGENVLKEQVDTAFNNIMKTADTVWGGFGKAPKFPQTFTIGYLLQYHHFTGNKEALEQALLSIDKMLLGGIYDQVGGGLARYSTDTEWLVPHFEKMLYDNALFINVLCDAFQLTRNKAYEKAIRETIDFVMRELSNGAGGFFAALDADSEGEEGKYYVWQKAEVEELLGTDAAIFCDFFNIAEEGNWEGKNIPCIRQNLDGFAQARGLKPGEFEVKIEACLKKLFLRREHRVRPLLDDKMLLGWNALMITALVKAGAALADPVYVKKGEECYDFLEGHFTSNSPETSPAFYHTYKQNEAKYPAFLDDYAYLIQACIHLQEATSSTRYLDRASEITEFVISRFSEPGTGFFFFTSDRQDDVIVRKKEVYDGAQPSGNSVMTANLLYLSVALNKPEWQAIAVNALVSLRTAIVNYPTSFSYWGILIMRELYGHLEIVITGSDFREERDLLLRHYLPNKVLQCAHQENGSFPMLRGKNYREKTSFYFCKNYQCQAPVFELGELLLLLNNVNNN